MGMFSITLKKVVFRIALSMAALASLLMGMLFVVCFNRSSFWMGFFTPSECNQRAIDYRSPGSALPRNHFTCQVAMRSIAVHDHRLVQVNLQVEVAHKVPDRSKSSWWGATRSERAIYVEAKVICKAIISVLFVRWSPPMIALTLLALPFPMCRCAGLYAVAQLYRILTRIYGYT